jgi:hypothetical protein
MLPPVNALLLRFPAGSGALMAASGSRLGISGASMDLEPLFTTADTTTPASGLAATSTRREWMIARLNGSTAGANPWDIAHDAMERSSSGVGFAAGAMPDIVEPDLLQQWPYQSLPAGTGDGNALAAATPACVFSDQNSRLPARPGQFAWQLADAFSQLESARSAVPVSSSAIVRIVHLDTGYDPNHVTSPTAQLDLSLQRNFVENTGSAVDPGNTGPLRNPGHGTATLAILAGGRVEFSAPGYQSVTLELGGTLHARIVPVRIGNSVVQIRTSDVAKGINYAAELSGDATTRTDVISMSMGGVASAAWADAVNKAYEAGIIFVAAAGNNISRGFFGIPTHQIVYPARFRRVIAACGVMADRTPYYGLRFGTMQGNWGPEGAMATAMSAYTPNVPWARWGCSQLVGMDGAGTSAATPQIAAAAALYLQSHFSELFDAGKYPEPWMRVEAVRTALYRSADKTADAGKTEKLGNGILRALDALNMPPVARDSLRKAPVDQAGFPFLNVLSSTALTSSSTDRMLQLEATQLIHQWDRTDLLNPLESAMGDPDRNASDIAPDQVRQFLEGVTEHPNASNKLKTRARKVLDGMSRKSSGPRPKQKRKTEATQPAAVEAKAGASTTAVPSPPYRKLRGYAVDPSLTTALATVGVSEMTFKIPWEPLQPGPVGEYLEVMDLDPASNTFYEPVNLDAPQLLAQDGLPPSEGIPQFHQQMVYAVASLTIANFEHALGRRTLWRPRPIDENRFDDSHFVQKLRIYPHALREANAYYSPQKVALLFGYFNATGSNPKEQLPGGSVFTCLSHDIVAHETTHALLDGMHRQFLLPSNRDVHAFHEGFADCVALLQHFTFPDLVSHQIASTRGEINSQENFLVQLASQFGIATGKRTALRDAIGEKDPGSDKWKLREVDPMEYQTIEEPHERGHILVAAVFDAFLSIYKRRTADLLRLATGGTGILRPGAVHPDLVTRLSAEAAKSAQHVLTMCIRALDYCPPTDITFGEYLRAVVTADHDLVPDDDLNYRVAFVEAFRRRGIFPPGVRTMSVGSLLWKAPDDESRMPTETLIRVLEELRGFGLDHLYVKSREEVFNRQRAMRVLLHTLLERHFKNEAEGPQDAEFLGLDPTRSFQVHMARIAFRSRPDGGVAPQLLIGLLQSAQKPVDASDPNGPTMAFEGGCTIVADLRTRKISYCIRKDSQSSTRLNSQQGFALNEFDSLSSTYLGCRSLDGNSRGIGEPFALMHRNSKSL